VLLGTNNDQKHLFGYTNCSRPNAQKPSSPCHNRTYYWIQLSRIALPFFICRQLKQFAQFASTSVITTKNTRHRASTIMYSLTFCVGVMSPERHHWKPAVQAATVMLRTPPIDGQSPASEPRPLPIYGAQCWERLHHTPVTNQLISNARTPRVN